MGDDFRKPETTGGNTFWSKQSKDQHPQLKVKARTGIQHQRKEDQLFFIYLLTMVLHHDRHSNSGDTYHAIFKNAGCSWFPLVLWLLKPHEFC